ncbi:MAG: radical SAM protein [Candidatus Bathyarchaeota archaeon]|nr:MAG: radical SAM protein [Candidatus Bathyarchaeota archaeon]
MSETAWYWIHFLASHTLTQNANAIIRKISPRNTSYLLYGPSHLLMRVTSRCNQRCLFCPRKAPSVPRRRFEFDDVLIDRFAEMVDRFRGVSSLTLTGGEPFLNKDIFEMMEYANSRSIRVFASTNGAVLDDKIDQIIRSPLSHLNISLDAVTPSDYESMHGEPKSIFYKVLDNIAGLVEEREKFNHHLELGVSYICTKGNFRRIPDMIQLAREIGVDALIFYNLVPFDLPGFSKDDCLYEEDPEVAEVIESVEEFSPELSVMMPALYRSVILNRFCRMPFTTLCIDGEGFVSVCCQSTSQGKYGDVGNILRDENVWNNQHFRRMREILMNDSKPLPELCTVCPHMNRPYKIISGE